MRTSNQVATFEAAKAQFGASRRQWKAWAGVRTKVVTRPLNGSCVGTPTPHSIGLWGSLEPEYPVEGIRSASPSYRDDYRLVVIPPPRRWIEPSSRSSGREARAEEDWKQIGGCLASTNNSLA